MSKESGVAKEVNCGLCSRLFRRESDQKCHKCVTEWQKPVSEQLWEAQCMSTVPEMVSEQMTGHW